MIEVASYGLLAILTCFLMELFQMSIELFEGNRINVHTINLVSIVGILKKHLLRY